MKKVRVLLVDDSLIIREVLKRELSSDPEIEVMGTAQDAFAARDIVAADRPDVVVLDLEMPRMDGLTFLGKVMRHHPLPVVVFSSLTTEGSDMALEALETGAVDVLGKPGPGFQVAEVAAELAIKVKAAARVAVKQLTHKPTVDPLSASGFSPNQNTERVILIGASTGGPVAVEQVLASFPENCPPTVLALHMPPVITASFGRRLNNLCKIRVREAHDGDRLESGLALLAPGDRHMLLARRKEETVVQIKDGPRVHHCRPSVDVLFRSAARSIRGRAIGVLLTGMGQDGAKGLLEMRQAGASTIAQSEETCVVYGMPKAAVDLNAAEVVLDLEKIAARIAEISKRPMTPSLG